MRRLIQGLKKAIEPAAAIEAQEEGREIRIAFAGHEVLEENAFLQRRQRIDVLHVGRAAGYGRDDAVDLRLREFDQRQHVGRNAVCILA